MNRRQISKIEAFNATLHYLMAYDTVINQSPAFSSAVNLFRGKLNTLNATVGLQARTIKGVIEDKVKTKKLLAQQFAEYGALLYSWASVNGNNTLRRAVKFSASQIERMNDINCAECCRSMRNIANDNLGNLSDYGIDSNTVKTMDKLIDQFTSDAPSVDNAKKARVVSSAAINLQISELEHHLKDHVDMFVLSYQSTMPDFQNGYKENRKATDPRTSYSQVEGAATDKATKKGIARMRVVATLDDKTVTTETDENGHYQLRTPQNGIWKITFFHEDYTELGAREVEVKLGKTVELNVEFDRKN